MRLRTFTARSMPEALKQIKAELGEDAVILSTKELASGIQVTAAMEPDAPPAPRPAKPAAAATRAAHTADQLRYDVQNVLRFHNIPELFIAKMSATLNEAAIAHILARGRMNIADESAYFLSLALEHICAHFFQYHKPVTHAERIMLVGTPGIGKTLTIAKLATQYALKSTLPVVITTDVMRAGGVEQLKTFTDILGVEIYVCKNARELSRELKHADKDTPVLVDTAGCNPYDADAIAELEALANLSGVEPVLVMPSGMDSQEAIDMSEIFMSLPISRLIATRTDSTRRLGGLISVASAHKLALYCLSGSASVTDTIKPCTAKILSELLLGHSAKPVAERRLPNKLQSS